MVFEAISILFRLYCVAQCTFPYFVGVYLPELRTIFFPSHWLLSRMTLIVETMGPGERSDACRNWNDKCSERILAEPGIEPAISCSGYFRLFIVATGCPSARRPTEDG